MLGGQVDRSTVKETPTAYQGNEGNIMKYLERNGRRMLFMMSVVSILAASLVICNTAKAVGFKLELRSSEENQYVSGSFKILGGCLHPTMIHMFSTKPAHFVVGLNGSGPPSSWLTTFISKKNPTIDSEATVTVLELKDTPMDVTVNSLDLSVQGGKSLFVATVHGVITESGCEKVVF